MKQNLSSMPGTGHLHVPHVHAIHMHPAHWLQNHSTLSALFVATAVALLFIWIVAQIDINSVPPYLRQINDGAWYLFRY